MELSANLSSHGRGFDPKLYISELREAMSDPERSVSLGGYAKKDHKDLIESMKQEASIKASVSFQEARIAEPTIDDLGVDKLETAYIYKYTMLAKRFGLAALRLSDAENSEFANALTQPSSRSEVLDELGAEMRRSAIYLSDYDVSKIKPISIIDSSLVFLSSQDVKELTKTDEAEELGLTAVRRALHGYPSTPGHYLAQTIERSNMIIAGGEYADFSPVVIRKVVAMHPKNPEGYLANHREVVTDLMQSPKYAAFGEGVLNDITLFRKNPASFLDKAINKITELNEVPDYAELGNSAITIATLKHSKAPEAFLDSVLEKITELHNNRMYSEFFNPYHLKTAAIDYPNNPEGRLNSMIEKVQELVNDKRYASYSESDIKRVVLDIRTKNPEKLLDEALGITEELKVSAEFEQFTEAMIRYTALRNTQNTAQVLRNAIDVVNELERKDRYPGVGRKTLIQTVLRSPHQYDTYLKSTF